MRAEKSNPRSTPVTHSFKTLLVLAVCCGPLTAAPPSLEIPAEVKPAGGYARFTPKTDAKSVTYVGLSGVDAFPSEDLKDGKTFLLPVGGLNSNRYKFAAVASSPTGEQVRVDFVVVVAGNPLPPPNPPPMTEDKFVTDLRAALAADPADERVLLPKLVEFYQAAVKEVDLQQNWEALFLRLKEKATDLGTLNKMHNVAVVISERLKKVLPTGTNLRNVPITEADKADAKKAFGDVVTALKKVVG